MKRIIDFKTGQPQPATDSMQLFAYGKLIELNPTLEAPPGLVIDKKNHTYAMDGSPVVSVTQVLRHFDPGFYNDLAAAQRGTFIHLLCQQFCEMGNINWVTIRDNYPDVIPYMHGFTAWYNENDIEKESVICERSLVSVAFGFSGTVDIIIDGEKDGLYNLYLGADGKYKVVNRTREKYYNWNLFSSMLNTYNYQKRENLL